MRQVRTDRRTALKVEKGLIIQRSSSTNDAAQYLSARGVPMHVAVRVLTTPHKRDMRIAGALPQQVE
ncbi:hypothetical protein HHL21_16800 [Massilia sp. RP-1-19]|uniref:Uncharacterized protein n=1 Tax=Massilia polaris TaxID=2728846 RepID=A0A848HNX9_9BURK|nr:hypothetical protein [Massilia polaris]NML62707.1 hypothetical protein [Massilia polaris]